MLKGKGFCIHLDTVGYQFKDIQPTNLLDLVNNVDLLGLPLDGQNEDTNILFRGKRGVLTNVINFLDQLENQEIKVSINSVVHNLNKNDLTEMLKVISEYKNIVRWELHQFSPQGRGMNKKEFFITSEEFIKTVENLPETNIHISSKFRDGKENFLYIDSNGDLVVVKNGSKLVVLNILEINQEEITKIFLNFMDKKITQPVSN